MEKRHLRYMKINKITLHSLILIFIITIAAAIRLYNLSNVPPHLTADEAALGYNAYSILKTGRDEHGVLLPIIFKSFGDYKPGLYVYLTVPFVAIFGLNEFSSRIAGALFGILAVYILYKVVGLLFAEEKQKHLSLISAFLLALCPWHILFSRGAWEVDVALTFTLIGIYFFLKSFKSSKNLLFSAFFFALTLATYQGAKLSTAIVVVILLISFRKQFFNLPKKSIFTAGIVGLLMSLPIVLSLFNGQAGRLQVFSVFSAPRPEAYLQNFLSEGSEQVGTIGYYAFHPEGLNFLRGIMGRWFNHFSGRFLFFEGDWQNPRHSAPYVGMLNFLDLPLLLVGIVVLIKTKNREASTFIFLWLLFASLPAILSRDQVHAVRSLNMLVPLVLIEALGFSSIVTKISVKRSVLFIGGAIYLIFFVYYLDAYFVHLPKLNSQYWEYGFKQAVQTISPIQNQYKTIIFQQSYSQPYIYFLFYEKYDPKTYQSQSANHFIASKYGDVGQVSNLDNIQFKGIDWQVLRGQTGTLVVGDSERIPVGDSQEGTAFHVIKEIPYLNGKSISLRIIDIK